MALSIPWGVSSGRGVGGQDGIREESDVDHLTVVYGRFDGAGGAVVAWGSVGDELEEWDE